MLYDSSNRGLLVRTIAAVGQPAESDALNSYDAAGQVSAPRNTDGYWTNYGYDGLQRPVQTTDALSGVQRQVYDLSGQVIATRDELGRWTQDRYNPRGWLTQSIDALGNTTTTTYDQAGNVLTLTDPLNHTSTFSYDVLNRQVLSTDPLNHTSTTAYDAAGNILSLTDPLGHVTSYAYDPANRRTATIEAFGTSVQRTLTTTYDAAGNAIADTDGLGHTVTYTYDPANRRIADTDSLNHTATTSYDAAGNILALKDPLGKSVTYTYDALNRRVGIIDPLSHTNTTMYDAVGQAVATIDPLGDTSVSGYDALGRVPVSVTGIAATTRLQYDAAGNPVKVQDPVANQTGFVSDALNRTIIETDPLGHSTTSTYDSAGRLTSIIDRLGRRQDFTYDQANRLTGDVWRSAGGSIVNTQTFTYDANGDMLSASDASGTYTFAYDALGQRTGQQDLFGIMLTYTYDPAGRRTGAQDSLGGTTTSVYDIANRLTTREFGGPGQTPLRVDLSYDSRNGLIALSRSSDLAGTQGAGTSSYSYDDAGRLLGIVNKSSLGATLSYYNYGYDSADRVTSESWQSGATPGAHTYTYDRSGQLLGDGTQAYSYDANGNRTMSGYALGADNQLTTDGVWTYTYDAEGNQVKKSKGAGAETWYLGYDNANHLTSATQESTDGGTVTLAVTYTYDVFGNRVQQAKWLPASGVKTMRFAYDGQDVWADLDGGNGVMARYLRGDGTDQLFARTEASGQPNPGVTWYLTDRLGSVRDLMDASQALRDHLDYDGYGNVAETNAGYGDRYKFTGREFDSDTGLQENRNRYYDPKAGRWTSQDPTGFNAGDSNLYRYVGNNATGYVDPIGLWELNWSLGYKVLYAEVQIGLLARGWGSGPIGPLPIMRGIQEGVSNDEMALRSRGSRIITGAAINHPYAGMNGLAIEAMKIDEENMLAAGQQLLNTARHPVKSVNTLVDNFDRDPDRVAGRLTWETTKDAAIILPAGEPLARTIIERSPIEETPPSRFGTVPAPEGAGRTGGIDSIVADANSALGSRAARVDLIRSRLEPLVRPGWGFSD
jgi:RHS repeat-associated protein